MLAPPPIPQPHAAVHHVQLYPRHNHDYDYRDKAPPYPPFCPTPPYSEHRPYKDKIDPRRFMPWYGHDGKLKCDSGGYPTTCRVSPGIKPVIRASIKAIPKNVDDDEFYQYSLTMPTPDHAGFWGSNHQTCAAARWQPGVHIILDNRL